MYANSHSWMWVWVQAARRAKSEYELLQFAAALWDETAAPLDLI